MGKGRRDTNAVLLLINVILASASKSDLAPAFNRSEKWSSAAPMALYIPPKLVSFDESNVAVEGMSG